MISPQFCMKYHSFAHRSKRQNAEISKDEKEVSDTFACLMFHILFCCKLACYFKATRVLVARQKKGNNQDLSRASFLRQYTSRLPITQSDTTKFSLIAMFASYSVKDSKDDVAPGCIPIIQCQQRIKGCRQRDLTFQRSDQAIFFLH